MITQPPQMQMVIMQPSDSPIVLSSIGSTANREHYAIDDIVAPTACSLVISYGITNVHMIEVATGLVIPGHDYHRKKIPDEYCKVEVLTDLEGHRDDFLDIPTPDGVEKLSQAINEFILWPRRYIRLNDPIPSMPYFGVDDEGGFSHAASLSHTTPLPNPPSQDASPPKEPEPNPTSPNPPSRNAPPSPIPNPPPSFSLHTILEPLPNPPPSPSKKDASLEPKGHVAKGKSESVPKMVTPFGNETSPGVIKKWMAGFTRRLETRSIREKAAKSASNKITIRKPMRDDYDNVPTDKYVPVRPLLQWCELRCVSRAIKRLHDSYMRSSLVGINAFYADVPPLTFMGGPSRVMVDFEEIWLMFHLDKLDIQLMSVWCL